jgi:hypothetical protein
MFIGHYALALGAKRVVPRTSLGTLFAATSLADLLWPLLLLTGWERVSVVGGSDPFLGLSFDLYPISHSLVTLIGWGLLFGLLYRARTGYARGAVAVGLVVVSHWVLDLIVHVPDLPIYPGSAKVGFGLWRSPAATVIVEGLMFVVGSWMYLRGTRARDRVGRYGLWVLLVVLILSYVASLFAGSPPTVTAIAIGGTAFGWLFVAWAAWADRHREPIA